MHTMCVKKRGTKNAEIDYLNLVAAVLCALQQCPGLIHSSTQPLCLHSQRLLQRLLCRSQLPSTGAACRGINRVFMTSLRATVCKSALHVLLQLIRAVDQ